MSTVKCPYNPSHIMPPQSLQNHLIKCQATNKHLFTNCRYNRMHIILKQKIKNHQNECSDAKILGVKKYDDDDDDWGVPTAPTKNKNSAESNFTHINQSIVSISKNSKAYSVQDFFSQEESYSYAILAQSQKKKLSKKETQKKEYKNFQTEEF